MSELIIRQGSRADIDAIFNLYSKVSKVPGGLARLDSEIDREYIQCFVTKACNAGHILVAERDAQLLGEIHGYKSGLFCFSHVLSELTIVVSPESQGQGVGRLMFQQFINHVSLQMAEVLRVELIARESNRKAIAFYESLGFEQEGCFNHRIRNLDGTLESDIPMAWCRPGV